MPEVLTGVSPRAKAAEKTKDPHQDEQAAVRPLVRAARARGDDLSSPDGLVTSITKQVIETVLAEQMSERLGYDTHAVQGCNHGNSRHGSRALTVLTDNAGMVDVEVPRDREGTVEPVIVTTRQRRMNDVDAVVISLSSRGLTTGGDRRSFRAGLRGLDQHGHGFAGSPRRSGRTRRRAPRRPVQPVYVAGYCRCD